MSVLAGPLFWMISEGSVHSSLVIGLRGGRFAGFTAVGGDRPPWPQPTSNGPATNQSASYNQHQPTWSSALCQRHRSGVAAAR